MSSVESALYGERERGAWSVQLFLYEDTDTGREKEK